MIDGEYDTYGRIHKVHLSKNWFKHLYFLLKEVYELGNQFSRRIHKLYHVRKQHLRNYLLLKDTSFSRFHSHWALAMQKWQIFARDFAREWIEYPFLAMTANANAQSERTVRSIYGKRQRKEKRKISLIFVVFFLSFALLLPLSLSVNRPLDHTIWAH